MGCVRATSGCFFFAMGIVGRDAFHCIVPRSSCGKGAAVCVRRGVWRAKIGVRVTPSLFLPYQREACSPHFAAEKKSRATPLNFFVSIKPSAALTMQRQRPQPLY